MSFTGSSEYRVAVFDKFKIAHDGYDGYDEISCSGRYLYSTRILSRHISRDGQVRGK
jgi:hypothetical protein